VIYESKALVQWLPKIIHWHYNCLMLRWPSRPTISSLPGFFIYIHKFVVSCRLRLTDGLMLRCSAHFGRYEALLELKRNDDALTALNDALTHKP
jgi:hypothetical protein